PWRPDFPSWRAAPRERFARSNRPHTASISQPYFSRSIPPNPESRIRWCLRSYKPPPTGEEKNWTTACWSKRTKSMLRRKTSQTSDWEENDFSCHAKQQNTFGLQPLRERILSSV